MMALALDKWATWHEIHAQPAIWRDWAAQFDPAPIRDWIGTLAVGEIWLTGAGTSAYIGDIVAAALAGQQGPLVRSVPSTDIVSNPGLVARGAPKLIVSFGRSGDSTESLGVLDALDALAPATPRLNITCNGASTLANRRGAGPERVIVLPDATHDSGFAMTSSFSTMLLTALGLLDQSVTPGFGTRLTRLAGDMETLLAALPADHPRPDRVVFLGSGPMAFAAREAALKVMELTAGQTAALWDSTLGFRHGPKSFVQDGTAVYLLTQRDPHTHAYEADLAAELRNQFPRAPLTTIGPGQDIDMPMPYGPGWSAPVAIGVAQVLGVRWAADIGLNVDDPFAGKGTLTRVVSGVTLHPVTS